MKRRQLLKTGFLGVLAPIFPASAFAKNCEFTTSDIEGPFYTPNAPVKHKLSPQNAPGSPLFLTGTVYANDCETPVPQALIDVWHANNVGAYDSQGYNYRGKIYADNFGNYSFETVLPGKYLNGAEFRPRHIHFKISGPNTSELTTQLYFEGDTSIPVDPWASDPGADGRIIPLTSDSQENYHGVFDIYLNINKEDVPVDLQKVPASSAGSQGRIVSIAPNPVKETTIVTLAKPLSGYKNLSLMLLSVDGKLIRQEQVNAENIAVQKVSLSVLNASDLKPNGGVYILVLKIDGLITDAKRLIIL